MDKGGKGGSNCGSPLRIVQANGNRGQQGMKRHLVFCMGLLGAALAAADGLPPTSLPESNSSSVGYKTVAEALASLKEMKDTSFSLVRGWTIVTDQAHLTVWSFAPKTDASYPAVVKRMVTSFGSGSKVTMSVLCEADKTSCDNLVREFYNMNFRGTGAQLENK
jgi:hypothetical protein